MVDQGPGECHPLLVSAGEHRRLALFEAGQLDESEHGLGGS